jgi:hypothetical protein
VPVSPVVRRYCNQEVLPTLIHEGLHNPSDFMTFEVTPTHRRVGSMRGGCGEAGCDRILPHLGVPTAGPDFRTTTQHTIAVLFSPRAFADMDRQERIRA